MSAKVLIVDDNALYRSAFKRNLLLRDYDVFEAENADEAMAVFQDNHPEVIVTDLSMRTPTEGLDVIRAIKQIEPLVPVVMISAVGTFEEGAEANRLGAHSVISKSRIDDEIESLYKTIESARASWVFNCKIREEIENLSSEDEKPASEAIHRLREIASDTKIHESVRVEAYDKLASLTEEEARESISAEAGTADQKDIMEADRRLAELIPGYNDYEAETRKELRTAEYFYQRQGGDSPIELTDFSRNIGFSFCFAVENEAKAKLRKRLGKFLSHKETTKLVRKLLDNKTGQIDLFYHQHLLRLQQSRTFDFTIDNVRQVFNRILEHESRYKPDGLKALGIVILCFGRSYEVKTIKGSQMIANPLNFRGLDTEDEILNFVHLLVSLQHYRNPYIHPEISVMEKISKIRETSIECLQMISKLT